MHVVAAPPAFFDTNVVLHRFSGDDARADRAESLIAGGGKISVQVLSELAAVARRKLGMSWDEVRDVTTQLRAVCPVVPLTIETHDHAVALADRYGLSIYDGTILASALASGCRILWSEDLRDGLRVEGRLAVRNPFA